ncbi:MAG: hypothetical protein LBT97_12130 [Planctomycetota bacterium]|nr:hypothetical protein [Planctomycetota bacterium]
MARPDNLELLRQAPGDLVARHCFAAQRCAECVILRADAEFASIEEMNALAKDGKYFVMRHKNTEWLRLLGAQFAVRPQGRPPSEGYHHVFDLGGAKWHPDWEHPLRILACVEDGPDEHGRLSPHPRLFFLVTTVPEKVLDADQIPDFYRMRIIPAMASRPFPGADFFIGARRRNRRGDNGMRLGAVGQEYFS